MLPASPSRARVVLVVWKPVRIVRVSFRVFSFVLFSILYFLLLLFIKYCFNVIERF